VVPESRRLVATGEAARALSVSVQTLQRWVRDGIVTPTATTAGGHHRWDIADLREQVRLAAQQRTQDAEDH
jgi:DNA-binding transcriptional MerR regulator